jgi:hypothetical protein
MWLGLLGDTRTVCLPPRKVILDFSLVWIKHNPSVKGWRIEQGDFWEIPAPVENIARREEGCQRRDNLGLTAVIQRC